VFSWFFKGSRRRKLMAEPVPDDWRGSVARNVGIFALLPEAKQQRLLGASRVIAAERHWVGCRGLEMTDEIKATVAAQAAILLLGVEGYYFDKLPAILIYPGTFVRPHSPDQLTVDEDAGALGESWQGGNIVLSWESVLAGGRDPHDGHNVVLHEFAHHLDSLDGEAGGHPPQPTHAAAEKWERVMSAEYERLVRAVEEGQPTLIDPYGAENEAEFFAVATETFFERPGELLAGNPSLYEILRDFYHVDPVSWFSGTRSKPMSASKRCAAPKGQKPRRT
jgi:Mlc titration factor MtfA (ptsG expression regulator)